VSGHQNDSDQHSKRKESSAMDSDDTTTSKDKALSGKVAIVTGASSGIGAGIAVALAADGARVVLVGRNTDRLGRTAGEIEDGGGSSMSIAVDVTAADGPQRIVNDTVEKFGQIDIVVHGAGIAQFAPFAQSGPECLDDHYGINVRAPWALTHAVLPHLGRGAAVVFISSNLAQVGQSEGVAYCASKGAVDAMMRALAVELAPQGIRVNAVSPGLIRTPMTSFVDDDADLEAALIANTPVGRLGEVADIAAATAFVCSDAASYMLGATMLVDGGWNAS